MKEWDELQRRVKDEVNSDFRVEQTWTVPSIDDTSFAAKGVMIETAFLYADVRGSSAITEEHRRATAAKIYRSFHLCMAYTARRYGGQIRSYDGDRILVVLPTQKGSAAFACDKAVQTAFAMVFVVHEVLEPKIRKYREFDFGIGIDYGKALLVRVGTRGNANNSGTVWAGRPANLAAKLSDRGKCREHVIISAAVHDRLSDAQLKLPYKGFFGVRHKDMWERSSISFAGGSERVYSSDYWLSPDGYGE